MACVQVAQLAGNIATVLCGVTALDVVSARAGHATWLGATRPAFMDEAAAAKSGPVAVPAMQHPLLLQVRQTMDALGRIHCLIASVTAGYAVLQAVDWSCDGGPVAVPAMQHSLLLQVRPGLHADMRRKFNYLYHNYHVSNGENVNTDNMLRRRSAARHC